MSVFHLNNRQANRDLKVFLMMSKSDLIQYLGITLDRTLSFKPHLENLAKKIGLRVSIIRKLAGVNWGADAATQRSSVLGLVYPCGEYGALVWLHSSHVYKVDVQKTLKNARSDTLNQYSTNAVPM